MPDIRERMMQLLPDGLRSWDEPILIFINANTAQLANHPIPVGSIKVKLGMTKILSSWMLMIAALELDEADRELLAPVLCTFGKIQCTWDGNANVLTSVYSAIGYKMSRSLTQRVDPDQLLDALQPAMLAKKAEQNELSDEQLIDVCCNDYNHEQNVDGAKIDHRERSAAKFIHKQLPATRDVIKHAWRPSSV